MAAAAFLGYLLLAAGPPLVVWCSFIAHKSFLVLLALASSFYWLLVLLLTSLIFRVFVPFPDHAFIYVLTLIVVVTIQEAARYGAYFIHQQLLQGLHTMGQKENLPKVTEADKLSMALTHGMGHAIGNTAFLYFSWISLSTSKGTLYLDACPQMSYFLAAGLLSVAFFMLHCFSMVVAFYGLDKGFWRLPAAVAGLHYLASLTTAFNMVRGACVPVAAVTLIQGSAAVIGAGLVCSHQASRSYVALDDDDDDDDDIGEAPPNP